MLEKWKQRIIKMNFRNAVIFFIVASFVLVSGFSVVVYRNFQGRVFEWEQFSEMGREHGREEKEFDEKYKFTSKNLERDEDFKEGKEKDWEGILKKMYLSAGDIALIAGCCIILIVIGVWYWMLVLIAVYRKAYHMGVNATL